MTTEKSAMKPNNEILDKLNLPAELREVLDSCPELTIAHELQDLIDLACGGPESDYFEVAYDIASGPRQGERIVEATVARVRNGIVANYPEPYMRRRDPNCMVIADDRPTDKPHYREVFKQEFTQTRQETLDWFKTQELCLFVFRTGRMKLGYFTVALAPKNSAFFALGLAYLQGILNPAELPADFAPKAAMYIAPPFRHTHFDGKQIVVHNRREDMYEMFAYNLYPGPSAKKGVYGMLIGQGEKEGWVTAHCSVVKVITPYDNVCAIMHEGASGGGKSEMLQQAHRLPDGRLLLGQNIVTNERRYLEIPRTCDLQPVTDDMALCHPDIQEPNKKLWVTDAENAWFVRVDHITEYGTDLDLEKLTAQPARPLLFLNVDAVPGGRAMIWEHIEDAPGKPCPNPRVIIPRDIVPGIVDEPVKVDLRSLGVRTPPCTRENPSYGIVGYLHVLPPALAWLWRLVAPRGHANPSIISTEGIGSEGVGSYWPFATGRKVVQANLLLEQIERTPRVRYILTPNQYVGAWQTGFMPQWVARDYLARRGSAWFNEEQMAPARCPLLGWAVHTMRVEGAQIPRWLLEVEKQFEVGEDGYDAGATILREFFLRILKQFLENDLSPLGRRIIECCMDNGSADDYYDLLPNQR